MEIATYIITGIVLLITFAWLYRWKYEYRTTKPVITQYEPYKNFKPMFTGVLFDSHLDHRDIAAGLVYLAQQGFISITHTTEKFLFVFECDDYEVALLRSETETETESQKQLLSLIFRYAGRVGLKVRLSSLAKDQSKRMFNLNLVKKMKEAVVADLVANGFIEQRVDRAYRTGLWIFPIMIFWMQFEYENSVGALPSYFWVVLISLYLSLLVILFLGGERRTVMGYESLVHLQGFKRFLSITEAERYKFYNAPDENPRQFMEYLPYAIAFGVEKEWVTAFRSVPLDAPTWYYGLDDFSLDSFIRDIDAFTSLFIQIKVSKNPILNKNNFL